MSTPSIVLSASELEQLTGYAVPTKQLQVLHRRGFHRAFISRKGGVVLERTHYEAVTRAEVQNTVSVKKANLSFLKTA